MNREAELAQLLMQMGAERGLDLEQILAELSALPLPAFVDAAAVHEALLSTVESWWRADLEDRLSQLRQQFTSRPEVRSTAPVTRQQRPTQGTPAASSVAAAPVTTVEPETMSGSNGPVTVDSDPSVTIHEETATDAAKDPAEALPGDATMIWTTRG